jgi:release factor glutamine methyltransferase
LPASLEGWIDKIRDRLAQASETAGLDAQVLLARVLGRSRTWVLAHPESEISPEQAVELDEKLARLASGEPLPYVLGEWEFYGLDFEVIPGVLIPRPETELLVDEALGWLKNHPTCRLACDVGTGSGCIAVALAVNIPDLLVLASDISSASLRVAGRNVERHGLRGRVHLVQADLLPGLRGSLDLISANLPYIPTRTLEELQVTKWEPRSALDGGPDGLDLIRRLLEQARARVTSDGLLLLEIEAGQGASAMALAQRMMPEAVASVLADLAGLDRLLKIQIK